MKTTLIVKQLLAVVLLCVVASAQTPQSETKTYAQDGLSFNYPDGWTLTDKSHTQAQHLILTRTGGAAIIMVIAYREVIAKPEQLLAAQSNVLKSYAESMAREFGIKEEINWRGTHCRSIGGLTATGFKLNGQYKGQPSTGEVYALMLGRRLVNAVYVRHDREDAQAAPVWEAVVDSLKVEEPANAPPLPEGFKTIVTGGVLNGKVLKKPPPRYPSEARSVRAQGTVVVQLVVDEKGNVVSAQAISGPPLLRDASEQAARSAKFSPTLLCGQPVKVTGVITYGFVLQ
jgi:TonB family protein